MDTFRYTSALVEEILLLSPKHLDDVELAADCGNAFVWLRATYPSLGRLVTAAIAGWSLEELSLRSQLPQEAVYLLLQTAYSKMSQHLNGNV